MEAQYATPAMQRFVDGWRLESKVVVDRLIDHFREMGIYTVTRQNEGLILDGMRHQLRHSPEIMRLVMRANAEEMRRTKSRHGGD